MRNLRYGLQEKSAHRFNTLADILSKIARKVSKNRKFKLNQQALISIFMLHNLFTFGIHRRPLMLSFEERGCQLIDSPFLSDYFTVRTLSTISRTHLSIPKRELFSTIW